MAAAEVLTFAASGGWQPAEHFCRATHRDGTIRRERELQVDIQLQLRLSLISEAWIQLRSATVSFRYFGRSCLDTAHHLFLSYFGHGLGCSFIQRSDYLDRAAAVSAWCWAGVGERFLRRCQCQHFPVELALQLPRVHLCDWSLPKLILTDGLCSSLPA